MARAKLEPLLRAEGRAHRPASVLIVDDHALVREGIRMLLRQDRVWKSVVRRRGWSTRSAASMR